jgi:hypothetical protein
MLCAGIGHSSNGFCRCSRSFESEKNRSTTVAALKRHYRDWIGVDKTPSQEVRI